MLSNVNPGQYLGGERVGILGALRLDGRLDKNSEFEIDESSINSWLVRYIHLRATGEARNPIFLSPLMGQLVGLVSLYHHYLPKTVIFEKKNAFL